MEKRNLTKVTKECFFATVGAMDIALEDHDVRKHETVWRTRRGQVVGRSTPGYLCEDENGSYCTDKTYYLYK